MEDLDLCSCSCEAKKLGLETRCLKHGQAFLILGSILQSCRSGPFYLPVPDPDPESSNLKQGLDTQNIYGINVNYYKIFLCQINLDNFCFDFFYLKISMFPGTVLMFLKRTGTQVKNCLKVERLDMVVLNSGLRTQSIFYWIRTLQIRMLQTGSESASCF